MAATTKQARPLLVYTPAQLAQMLGVTEKTLANWRSRREGPAFARLGGRGATIVYREQDVAEYLDNCVVETRL